MGSDNIIAGCIERDVTYSPLNIPGHDPTMEPNAKTCQNRCANTNGCSYFSYLDGGECYLSGPGAIKRMMCPIHYYCGYASGGPKFCVGM